ncbi:uncharacterized protein LOC114246601 [Bombyx mandarina]|uniref:Uncharacterized protein LOC114246601 n=1 Tax=Bombyx mandarina TaxID=7092 RepID=A0A6J2K3X3_BOMMA|nr:uncharacterized protein LOC114246601 [Bombyx mandarina]XP_028035009.1 uncharacterized protein LOC114246601 [Bombyx mandarina]XP_028035010.1 uncharacterized protein LOC114246601 [Bombyx mandarina]XP_028035011.1 uncharacterized protein LOC114246601 [Bombyx mandarina]
MNANKKAIVLLTLINILLVRSENDTRKDDVSDGIEQKANDQSYDDDFLDSPDAGDGDAAGLTDSINYRNDTANYEDPVETSTASDYVTQESDVIYEDSELFNSTYADEKMETTSLATTRAMEDYDYVSSKAPESDGDQEVDGQGNPKTDGSEQTLAEGRQFNGPPQPVHKNKSSTLRSWLEDSWLRQPVAVLVPLRPMALSRALAVWNDLIAEGLNVSDIVIVGYDSNGISWRSRHNLHSSASTKDREVSEALSKLMLKYQGVHTDTASDGTMRALASAAKLVPYDSALFVITDKGAGDPQRLALALRTLVDKRLKVYTIWTNPDIPTADEANELQELRNISQHTEGDVLPYSTQVMDLDGAENLATEDDSPSWNRAIFNQGRQGRLISELEKYRYDTLLVRRGGGEAISLGLTVENGVTALRVLIEGAVEHAVLYPPNDAPQIDLYDTDSVSSFSAESRTASLSPRDVYLILPGANTDVDALSVLPANPDPESQPGMMGKWHLSVRCDTCDYRLCVMARAQIHLDVGTDGADMLKLRVTGPVASVRESLIVDEYGTELANLPFSYQPMVGDEPVDQRDLSTELMADVVMPSIKGNKNYVKIIGRDVGGEPFVRLAGPLRRPEARTGRSAAVVFPDAVNDLERVENENLQHHETLRSISNITTSRIVSQVMNQRGALLTAVQIGLRTTLYGAPGDNLQLHFEVTNYREQSVRFTFGAVGELRLLTGISPAAQLLTSGQTANVIVSATIPTNAQPGTRDLITFTAYGTEPVSISAHVYVINTGETVNDVLAPEVSHVFQGSCIGRTGQDCAQYVWSATIIARDSESGLLRLSSSPIGLTYENFISGTRDQVTATYRATCCAPRMLVNAVDASGNTNSYVVDISGYLSETAIAAIVLGIILGILLIALIAYLIYLCVKRRKESRELPYSTSSRNIS